MTTTDRLRLLDVNVLVALSLPNHAHHEVVSAWFDGVDQWATCSITQAAYVRLLMNPRVTGFEIAAADVLSGLGELTSLDDHVFLVDDAPPAKPSISFLRLKSPKQVTDLHLVDLAARHNAVLATMDGRMAQALMSQDRRHIELIPL